MATFTLGRGWVGLTLPLGTINDPRYAEYHRKRRLAVRGAKAPKGKPKLKASGEG